MYASIGFIIVLMFVCVFWWMQSEVPITDVDLSNTVSALSEKERELVGKEFAVYNSRGVEQTYLTLPEWYMVYSYNEFGDFLQENGKQTDFPFIKSIKNFWSYYSISLAESRNEKFNWNYNFVSLVIGVNFTVEYLIKSVYENTVGNVTQFISGSETGADVFIANSWNTYAEKMYQTTWYHYPYFDDLKGIWTTTPLFDASFVRNLERKSAFTFSYFIKGVYAKLWLLTAIQKENQTLSIVSTSEKYALQQEDVKILKELGEDRYLIETERYAGFKKVFLRLVGNNVKFMEIMGHNVIALSYLSKQESDTWVTSQGSVVVDKRKMFFNNEDYVYRVTIKAPVTELNNIINLIDQNGGKFEMIYDF